MKIGIIGCGTMGSVFAACWAEKYSLVLFDQERESTEELAEALGAKAASSIDELVNQVDIILLAVKPQDVAHVAHAASLRAGQILLSVATGMTQATLHKHFPTAIIVRTMPSVLIRHRKGVIALATNTTHPPHVHGTMETLLAGMGKLLWFAEHKLDAITALTGSGPAFILMFVEALVEAGIAVGFTGSQALELVLETIHGTVVMAEETREHPAQIKERICSPGGTTIAGIRALENKGLRAAVMECIIACYERAKSLG